MRFLLMASIWTFGCTNVLSGTNGFTAERSKIIPCPDRPGALVVIESFSECWLSLPAERLNCGQWNELLLLNPEICDQNVVFDSPSTSTLTGFIDAPVDRSNFLGAATPRVLELPCNPAGPGAESYEGFEDAISVFTGDVRVTRDRGLDARIDVELYPTDLTSGEAILGEPAMKGVLNAQVCR